MATEETVAEKDQEALSDDLQADLEDDMFFGEEDQPGEEVSDSEDFLSEEELADSGTDELKEEDVAGDSDLEGLLEETDESAAKEVTSEDSLEMVEEELEDSLKEELSSEIDLEAEDLNENEDELPPLEEGDLSETLEQTDNGVSEENVEVIEELPPIEEDELNESESEESILEDSSNDTETDIPEDSEESKEEVETTETLETTEDVSEETEEILEEETLKNSEEDTASEEIKQEPEAELTLDEGPPEEDPETNPEPKAEVPTEPAMIVPAEADATVLSENQMTNEMVAEATAPAGAASDMLLHFQHEVRVEVARTRLTGKEITQITSGSIIELDKAAGEPVELVLDDRTIAKGEVVMINKDKLGLRIIGIVQK